MHYGCSKPPILFVRFTQFDQSTARLALTGIKTRIVSSPLVGSRAAGTATAGSDWDYVINGTSKSLNSVAGSLPGASNIAEGIPKNLDIFRGVLDEARPSITFFPAGP